MESLINTPPATPVYRIPNYVLDDLCSRFIINIPEEERQDLIRLFFQIELAHWFYLDFYCAENPELKSCGIKEFSTNIFLHCSFLSGHAGQVEKRLEEWRAYKMSVPTYGAIILDPDKKHVLLVQGFWTKSSWGFPKGKVNAEETPLNCAIREVMEETGFDISGLIRKSEFLENQMYDQLARLYIVSGVPLDTHFQPQTRKEIKSLQWFPIDSLPMHKKDITSKSRLGMNANNFFMVIPFVKHLRRFLGYKSDSQSDSEHKSSNNGQKPTKNREGVDKRQKSSGQRQQAAPFGQLLQEDYNLYMQLKNDSKQRSESPTNNNAKQRQQTVQSPKQQNKQQFQIMNRSGAISGPTRRNLSSQFDKPQEKSHKKKKWNEGEIYSKTWLTFKFDVDAIMNCLP